MFRDAENKLKYFQISGIPPAEYDNVFGEQRQDRDFKSDDKKWVKKIAKI